MQALFTVEKTRNGMEITFQEQLDLFEHALRCGILLQREVVLSLQCYELRAGNSDGKLATRLERLHLVFALVHDKRRHGDLGQ